jgi:hypothetical protein
MFTELAAYLKLSRLSRPAGPSEQLTFGIQNRRAAASPLEQARGA